MATKQATTAPASAPTTAQNPSGTALTNPAATPALVPLSEALGRAVMPAEFAEELASEAKAVAAVERPKIARISLRGGIMAYDGQEIPDNTLPCVILSMVYERTYYTKPFDENNVQAPECFALAEVEAALAPHEVVINKQNGSCIGCPKNEWNTDTLRPGSRGKACKERRRLVLLPTSALASPEEVKKAELALLGLPVMSVRNYSAFVNTLASTVQIPPYGAVTVIRVKPDRKSQFVVTFEPQSVIADPALLNAIRSKREEALRVALTPFEANTGEDADDVEETAAPAKKQKF